MNCSSFNTSLYLFVNWSMIRLFIAFSLRLFISNIIPLISLDIFFIIILIIFPPKASVHFLNVIFNNSSFPNDGKLPPLFANSTSLAQTFTKSVFSPISSI